MASSLVHETIYANESKISKSLDFIDSLMQYHKNGKFYLIQDPLQTHQASIIGMFVLRPAHDPPYVYKMNSNDSGNIEGCITSIYDQYDWCYNVNGLDGGGLIANGNLLDAYRLALQYGLSDAVIVGSNSVSTEGITTDRMTGYLWQPYGPCEWEHLKAIDYNLADKIKEQRIEWQKIGYLSSRNYPAQIVVTWTGEHYQNSKDFLEARIFHEMHPNGEPIEVYIITSSAGAIKIKNRAKLLNLNDRIDDMLIILPSKNQQNNNDLDFSIIPKLLYDKYGMRIVNHDGGHKVLLEFSKAGALSQMNLTLGKNISVYKSIEDNHKLDINLKKSSLEQFDNKVQYFFHSYDDTKSIDNDDNNSANDEYNIIKDSNNISLSIPKDLDIVSIISDYIEDAIVVTFDTSKKYDFYQYH